MNAFNYYYYYSAVTPTCVVMSVVPCAMYLPRPQGNLNLIAAAKQAGIKHFVLVTSIGTDDFLNPLNLFFLILVSGGGRGGGEVQVPEVFGFDGP